MGKYNFDQYIERRGTDSSKWDGFESRFPGYNASGALPMWVADMDFTARGTGHHLCGTGIHKRR